ncbi:MAG: hypothetical protein AAGI01_02510 [Myxococcota bacterium]
MAEDTRDEELEGDSEEMEPGADLEQWAWDEGADEADPELVGLSAKGGRGSILRPILMIGVLVMGAWILSDWQEELAYLWSPSEAIEIGAVDEFPAKAAEQKNWSPDIPHNRYVSVSGVPVRRSISERYKYFKLVGGEVYIEQPREDYGRTTLEKELDGPPKADVDRTMFFGSGRAISFAAMPERYRRFRQYYDVNYNTTFCVDLSARELAQLERQRRDAVRTMWRKQYEEATLQERAKKKLTPDPTVAEIEEALSAQPACVHAWLIQVDKTPASHWWYLALSFIFVGFMLVDLVFLVRWITRFVKPDDGL